MISACEAERLVRENEELRVRLEEAEDALRAIRAGEIDAVLVAAGREQVFTLESADRPYRLLVEQMPQGAATLTVEGTILYCNRHFADLVGRPPASLSGTPIHALVAPASQSQFAFQSQFALLLRGAGADSTQGEVTTAVNIFGEGRNRENSGLFRSRSVCTPGPFGPTLLRKALE